MDAEHEADLITGRACASCGGGITPESRVPHGGFWLCMPECCECKWCVGCDCREYAEFGHCACESKRSASSD